MLKPKKLRLNDTVALISLSWGGANEYPSRYLQGKKQLEETFRLISVNTPNALKSDEWLYKHPKERLNDLIWAFENPNIKAIISIIGGNDSIQILKYITKKHLKIIKNNPKIFVGFSDTTIINFLCIKAGITSFYGPSILFGLAENGGIHEYTSEYFKKALFSEKLFGEIKSSNKGWIIDMIPWDKKGNKIKRKMQKQLKIKFLQGSGIVEGKLIGGCMETLELLKGTLLWPNKNYWKNKILFLEISDESQSMDLFSYWLRNYGELGILENIKGILFAIPGGSIYYKDKNYKQKLDNYIKKLNEYELILKKVTKEYNREDMTIITNLSFGHTCPMITLPYLSKIELDSLNKKIIIRENCVN